MQYIRHYSSPLGKIIVACDDTALTELRFAEESCNPVPEKQEHPILNATLKWLDIYFSGKNPEFTPPLRISGTPFQNVVWRMLLKIPYGETTTYGKIAMCINDKTGTKKTSPRAVGNAVGRNRIPLIIPCHRVVGANGSLVGFACGINRKIRLLEYEKADMSKFFAPKSGNAL